MNEGHGGAQMTPEQLAEIERYWRNRPTPVYLFDRKRGLINATTDVLALVEALRHAWHELEERGRTQSDTVPP
jgi:hypothetical protein